MSCMSEIDKVLETLEVQANTTSGLAICAKYGKKFNCVDFTTRDYIAQPVLISPWMQFEPSEMADLRSQIAYEIARRAVTYPSILKDLDSQHKLVSSLYDSIDDKRLIEQKIYETWGKERASYGLKQDFTDVENSTWPAELMSSWRSNGWQLLDSAPKDGTRILWGGTWKPYDILPGGQKYVRIYSWTTIMSNRTGYHWMADDFSTPEDVHVEWTHWRYLPEF